MDDAGRKGWLERLLGLFTEVRAGEGGTALLLTLNVFLLLSAYYVIKPVREALILAGGGAEVKSYASVGQVLLLWLAVPLYARLASRMSRRRLINAVTSFFIACLVAFYLLAQIEVPLGIVFFLWVGIFNLMVIAQFWAFANDLYTNEQGKRLFAIVAFGASAGAVFGSWVTGRLIGTLGVYQMMLVAAAVLTVATTITNLVDTRERRRLRAVTAGGPGGGDDDAGATIGRRGAFELVLRHRYLLLIAFLMLFLNWVNTTGEYILGRVVERAAHAAVEQGRAGGLGVGEFIGRFYSDFFAVVNVLALGIQLFFVSRIVKYLGVRVAVLILPCIALGGYLLLAVYPVLGAVRWVKTAENATDYSLQNTVRNILFLPTTREEKYKAKQAIDTFFWRAGDVLSAALVFAGTTWLAFETRDFALFNLTLVGVWLVLAFLVGRRYARMASRLDGDNAREAA
ncbi:MAG: Npt1/Npt2 family nucleotide transporter [Candidatus Eiseniibacteriota bacterium]|jgi:AAA family ATP:ADP antiporter